MRLLLLVARVIAYCRDHGCTNAEGEWRRGLLELSIHPSSFLTMSESSMERVHRRKKTKRS